MAHAVLYGEFLLHTPCCLCGVFSYITGSYVYAGSLFSMPFVFHALCYLISGISLTHPMQVYVGRFSNSMQCVLSCKEFLLYSLCCFMWEISLTVLSAKY